MEYTKNFTISGWGGQNPSLTPQEQIKEWHDLGLTVMIAHCTRSTSDRTVELLDEAEKCGMQLIVEDWDANVDNLIINGEEYYRESVKNLLGKIGSHPALYGFYITDEPSVDNIEATLKACRINKELAPHLTAYLNLLPWFDWIGERMGTKEYAPYLDRVVKEGEIGLLSYDCYAQMYKNAVGYDDYFNNLREYYLASRRNGVPFWNIVLCTGHYDYMCPTKDDLIWQLNTSVAHGAKGVSWFILKEPNNGFNYRNAPINLMGERTPEFDVLSEVNRTFNAYHGKVFSVLEIDECYHVCKSYGGMPLFEPFGCILDVESRGDLPLIVSGYHDSEGGRYFSVCNNSPREVASVSLVVKDDAEIERCFYGNRFSKPTSLTDPVGALTNRGGTAKTYTFFLAPGQIALYKER